MKLSEMGPGGKLDRARYIMIGGFLGAGKTTALAGLARHLTRNDYRVGLITNDQSTNLVDSSFLRSQGYSVEEVAGGCFCCRFDSLNQAADRLATQDRPDFFLAEPVGSCTDLVATVSYPLRRMYGDHFSIAPLSVVLDAKRAARMFGLVEGRKFSPEVRYIYEKQIEEADIVLLNKTDLIEPALEQELLVFLEEEHPQATLIPCSARQGSGLASWFDLLEGSREQERGPLEIDYAIYTRGEAALGWLNATLRLRTESGVDGNRLLTGLCNQIRQHLTASGFEVAHLKATLDPGLPSGEIAVVSVVENETLPELRASVLGDVTAAQLILNLRAEAFPDRLETGAREAVAAVGSAPDLFLEIEHLECFQPAAPQPRHRLTREELAASTTSIKRELSS